MSSLTDDRDTSRWGSFPGGVPRLPRLSRNEQSLDDADVRYAESAFVHDPDDHRDEDRPASGFEAYYTRESLFEAPPTSLDGEPDRRAGPYAVLGLSASASWEEIARAHRALVSQLHPDRYVGADETVRAAAERRVRDVNEAFATIRRERSGRGR